MNITNTFTCYFNLSCIWNHFCYVLLLAYIWKVEPWAQCSTCIWWAGVSTPTSTSDTKQP
jgi:hypothetical protein